ncbi:hypothetical protein GCM10007049_05720 [Echinicola pacifica]|uniref:FecR family protein n=1 Tax=Echinicola pacifica TaxID=346377 RepID=A0A918PMV4_9BACT|nr:FecR domain-containing protein [Echinicola pacifica]GGZ16289.1 hypothetical protein GCM10007049_05720 [Echinicola pacifica]
MDESKLIKNIIKETSAQEREEIERWINDHPSNREFYDQIEWIWQKSQRIQPSYKIEVDDAWEKFQQLRDQQTSRKGKQRFLNSWIQIAAVFMVFFIAAGILYSSFMEPDNFLISNIQVSSGQETHTEELFDGSIITANRNSQLTFKQNFLSQSRHAELQEGEAYFKVAKNKEKPFIVKVGDASVKVLGTSFNIKKSEDKIEVILTEGSVEVEWMDKTTLLKPGEKILLSSNNPNVALSTIDDNLYNYYVGDYFQAQQTPLWRVVEILNEAYSANIIILKEDLRNLPLTTTFKNDSLESNLQVLQATFGLNIIREPNRIIIK